MILRKKLIRSDSFWTSRALYRDPIRRLAIFLDTQVLMRSQYWPRERIDHLVDLRLRDLAERIASIPLWKERFAKAGLHPAHLSRDTLVRLPLLTKAIFYENDRSFYTDIAKLEKSHVDHTSGSTGKPLQFYLDWRAELRYFAIRDRMFRVVSGGDVLPVVYFRGRVNPGFFFGRHHLFYLKGYNAIKSRLDAFVALVRSLRSPFVLYGYSSSMVELARRLAERGAHIPLRAIVATGEGIRESDRAFIESALDTRFFLTYATWEVKWIGHECAYRRCHLNEEYVYVEILGDHDEVLPDGAEGRIVVTSFESESMPFVRYAVGDRGVISREQCPCGRTSRTIQVYGRTSDIIELPGGRVVPLFDVSTAFDKFASSVRQYRVTQISLSAFRVQLVVTSVFNPDVQRMLESHLIALLHPEVSITWEISDEIVSAPSGKAAYFVREM